MILTIVYITVIISLTIVLILVGVWDYRSAIRYTKFLESFKPGDILRFSNDEGRIDPFSTYDPNDYKIILDDVKKNYRGDIYVQYHFLENSPNSVKFTISLKDLLDIYERVKEGE